MHSEAAERGGGNRIDRPSWRAPGLREVPKPREDGEGERESAKLAVAAVAGWWAASRWTIQGSLALLGLAERKR